MRTVRLGATGVRVPALGLGTWSFGGPNTVEGTPVGWSGHDDRSALAALVRAGELGITHWDTADVYGDGRAEELIARAWGPVNRDDIFLASKVGWDRGPHDQYYHPAQMRRQLERTLGNLRVEHLDLYYLHHCDFGPGNARRGDAVGMLHRFREQGLIRYIGLSDWDAERIVAHADAVQPDVIQVYRNVMDDSYEASGLGEWVRRHDTGVVFFGALRQGLLLGKYRTPPVFPPGDVRSRLDGFGDPGTLRRLQRYRDALIQRFGGEEPVLHGLLDPLLTGCETGCVLVGLRSGHQVEAAAQAGRPMSASDAAWVFDLYRTGAVTD